MSFITDAVCDARISDKAEAKRAEKEKAANEAVKKSLHQGQRNTNSIYSTRPDTKPSNESKLDVSNVRRCVIL